MLGWRSPLTFGSAAFHTVAFAGLDAFAGLRDEVRKNKADPAKVKEAVAKATAIREKEAAAFAKLSGDMKTNVAAMTKATAAVEKGMGGAFLQTSTR